jgi:hypothetical protein
MGAIALERHIWRMISEAALMTVIIIRSSMSKKRFCLDLIERHSIGRVVE